LTQEEPQRRAEGSARGLYHVRNAEIEPARTLAARRRDQAQRAAVEEQSSGHAGLTQQPLHASMCRSLEPARTALALVEILARREDAHQELPGRGAVVRVQLAHGQVRAQGFAILGERHLKLGRNWTTGDAGIPPRRKAPA